MASCSSSYGLHPLNTPYIPLGGAANLVLVQENEVSSWPTARIEKAVGGEVPSKVMISSEVGVRGVVIANEVLATFEVIKFRAIPSLLLNQFV